MATAEEMREVRTLIEELRGKDKAARLAATHQITRISKVLGSERCRNELLPYVMEGVTEVEDDEDILVAVADAFGELELFAALGDDTHLKMLLAALEPFLTFDNPNVRDRAVASIKKVLAALPPREMQGDGVSLIRQLAVSEFYGPRVAAPPLLVGVYALLTQRNPRELDGLRRELRFAFCTLCGDDSPVVRKSAATALSQLLPLLQLSEIEGEVYPILQKVCQDSQDSVRISRLEFSTRQCSCLACPSSLILIFQCGVYSRFVAHKQRQHKFAGDVASIRTFSRQVEFSPTVHPHFLLKPLLKVVARSIHGG